MRLVPGRLVRTTRRQLRHLIGAANHPPTRSLENADGQDGRNHAALLAGFNENISLIGESGGLSHAPFEQAASAAPVVNALEAFTDSKIHANGYH